MRKKIFFLVGVTCVGILSFNIFKKEERKVLSAPSVVISRGTVPEGGTLYTCLRKEGLSDNEIWQVEKSLKPIFDFRKCFTNDKYELIKSTAGFFQGFKYYRGTNVYEVNKSTYGKLVAQQGKIPLKKNIVGIKGKIDSSLWEAMQAQGVGPEVILNFAEIFSWQIDFLTEPRGGDTYKLIWERYSNDEMNIDGKILAAQYCGKETSLHTAIRFKNQYYDLKGKSLQKQFLRAPLSYRRISSYFSYRRFHPILRYWRPHLGIDYAAPIGTPVVSVADGTVVYKGWKGGYGRFIKIRHNAVYYTTYGHFSRYAKNIRRGTKVKQGQLIGYVGSTGLSTGPHLDFRVKKNGKFVNFLKLKFPSKSRISKKYQTEFTRIKRKKLSQLASIFNFCSSPCKIELAFGNKMQKGF